MFTATVTDTKDAEVLIEGEIPFEDLLPHRASVVQKLSENITLDGFRKGKVPEAVLVKHVGESTILSEMAERALQEYYPKILSEHNVDAIGRPQVAITKLAPNNPLGFKITTAVMPVFDLPDYTTLAEKAVLEHAKDLEEPEVTDAEVDDIIENIRKSRGTKTDAGEEVLPELTDDFVKTLGDFTDTADFRTKITDSLRTDKKIQGREKVRLAIIESLLEKTNVTLPAVLIEAELDKMLARFAGDIERMTTPASPDARPGEAETRGMTLEAYLEKIEKTEEDMRTEWRDEARKRAVTQLLLNKIAEKESIQPEPEKLMKEVEHVLEHHPDADKQNVLLHVAMLMTNEQVLAFLEGQPSATESK